MRTIQTILGRSLLSFFLVSLSYFIMCSGLMHRPGVDEELALLEEDEELFDLVDADEAPDTVDFEAIPDFQGDEELDILEPESALSGESVPRPVAGNLMNRLRAIVADEYPGTSLDPNNNQQSGDSEISLAFAPADSDATAIATPESLQSAWPAQFPEASAPARQTLAPAEGGSRISVASFAESETGDAASIENRAINAFLHRPELPTAMDEEATKFSDRVYEDLDLRYGEAIDKYFAREYTDAIRLFRGIMLDDTTEILRSNCQYWIASAYFTLGHYYRAIAEAEKILQYTDSEKRADAQLLIGQSWMRLGKTHLAKIELTLFVSMYKDGPLAGRARKFLNELSLSS